VQQVLIDPAGLNDWMVDLGVDLEASREADRPVVHLRSLGPIA
jgi:hypothetical protein